MARAKLSEFDRNLRAKIAKNLKKVTKNYTQAELSELTGIPASTISGYFSERSTINNRNLQKIADAMNVKKSDIDPRFEDTLLKEEKKNPYYHLTEKDHRDVGKELDAILSGMESDTDLAFYGEPLDDETRRLVADAIESNLRIARELAKKKYTPNKYRDNNDKG